ncbi:MAG: hypothetical protein HZB38_09475 [Planctomycetes bacterium]|nr:hypothetical protein [Planctomycetota bacterium]
MHIPTPFYDVTLPNSGHVYLGNDAVTSAGGYHMEENIDLDPYLDLGPTMDVVFDMTAGGGGVFGPFTINLAAGPDIYMEWHRMDDPETGQTPPMGLINLATFPVAFGVSITEDPAVILAGSQKHVEFPHGGAAGFDVFEPGFSSPVEPYRVEFVNGQLVVWQTPEPTPLAVLLGAMFVWIAHRNRK